MMESLCAIIHCGVSNRNRTKIPFCSLFSVFITVTKKYVHQTDMQCGQILYQTPLVSAHLPRLGLTCTCLCCRILSCQTQRGLASQPQQVLDFAVGSSLSYIEGASQLALASSFSRLVLLPSDPRPQPEGSFGQAPRGPLVVSLICWGG